MQPSGSCYSCAERRSAGEAADSSCQKLQAALSSFPAARVTARADDEAEHSGSVQAGLRLEYSPHRVLMPACSCVRASVPMQAHCSRLLWTSFSLPGAARSLVCPLLRQVQLRSIGRGSCRRQKRSAAYQAQHEPSNKVAASAKRVPQHTTHTQTEHTSSHGSLFQVSLLAMTQASHAGILLLLPWARLPDR